jgi:hypothetical protein
MEPAFKYDDPCDEWKWPPIEKNSKKPKKK